MGKSTPNGHTISHAVCGALASFVGIDIWLSNTVHLLIELNELNVYKNKVVETFADHVWDVAAFALGSLLAKQSGYEIRHPAYWYTVTAILAFVAVKEVLRELFPSTFWRRL